MTGRSPIPHWHPGLGYLDRSCWTLHFDVERTHLLDKRKRKLPDNPFAGEPVPVTRGRKGGRPSVAAPILTPHMDVLADRLNAGATYRELAREYGVHEASMRYFCITRGLRATWNA